MAVDVAPVRHRAETVREQDLRMELLAFRHDALSLCDSLEPRLTRLHGATIHLGPVAEQLCAGALHEVKSYRTRNER